MNDPNEPKTDKLFERIYGYRPSKKGASYELLVAAALKLILRNLKIKANQYVDATYSDEKYQIDSIIESISTAVEAKDYTDKGKKVGRPDVTKLAGALQDLPFDSGIVASATDFSRHAKKYADATRIIPHGKPIDLFHIRPSTEADEEGRITKIVVNLHVLTIDHKNVKIQPIISPSGNAVLKTIYTVGTQFSYKLDQFFKSDGSLLITLADLTRDAREELVKGSWVPPEPAFMIIDGLLIEISELQYSIPHIVIKSEIVIDAKGKAQLLVKSEDGHINKLLTDLDLKRISFSDDGSVNFTP